MEQKIQMPKINNKWFHKTHNRWYVTLNNNERIQYARYIIWEKIGIKPKEPFLVHHINKDTTDDRFENLKVVTRREHRIIHNIGNQYGKFPKSNLHKSRISDALEKYSPEKLFILYEKNKPISKRKFTKLCGYKSPGFLCNENRFGGGWTNFKLRADNFIKLNPKSI